MENAGGGRFSRIFRRGAGCGGGVGGIFGPGKEGGCRVGGIYGPGEEGGGNIGGIYGPGARGGVNIGSIYSFGARGGGNFGAIYGPGASGGGGNVGAIYRGGPGGGGGRNVGAAYGRDTDVTRGSGVGGGGSNVGATFGSAASHGNGNVGAPRTDTGGGSIFGAANARRVGGSGSESGGRGDGGVNVTITGGTTTANPVLIEAAGTFRQQEGPQRWQTHANVGGRLRGHIGAGYEPGATGGGNLNEIILPEPGSGDARPDL